MKTRTAWVSAIAVAALSTAVVGCGKKTCEDVAKNYEKLWAGKPGAWGPTEQDRKAVVEQQTQQCNEQPVSQEAMDCYASAADRAAWKACKGKTPIRWTDPG